MRVYNGSADVVLASEKKRHNKTVYIKLYTVLFFFYPTKHLAKAFKSTNLNRLLV